LRLTIKMNEAKKNPAHSPLRTLALIMVVTGGIVSLGLTLHAGRNNHSVLLVLLFLIWVSSPFLGLLVADLVSKRWRGLTRKTLYILMFVLTFGSLISYSGVLSPPGTKPAFVFLIVPLISWIFIAIVIPTSAMLARKQAQKRDSA
jgi:phosphate/sulfate permease